MIFFTRHKTHLFFASLTPLSFFLGSKPFAPFCQPEGALPSSIALIFYPPVILFFSAKTKKSRPENSEPDIIVSALAHRCAIYDYILNPDKNRVKWKTKTGMVRRS
jgi:hypothetical protein